MHVSADTTELFLHEPDTGFSWLRYPWKTLCHTECPSETDPLQVLNDKTFEHFHPLLNPRFH